MRIAYELTAKSAGLLRNKTTHQLVCTIEFNDQDKQMLKVSDFKEITVISDDGTPVRHAVADLIKQPHVYEVHSPSHAARYEERFTEALTNFKDILYDNFQSPTFQNSGVKIVEL